MFSLAMVQSDHICLHLADLFLFDGVSDQDDENLDRNGNGAEQQVSTHNALAGELEVGIDDDADHLEGEDCEGDDGEVVLDAFEDALAAAVNVELEEELLLQLVHFADSVTEEEHSGVLDLLDERADDKEEEKFDEDVGDGSLDLGELEHSDVEYLLHSVLGVVVDLRLVAFGVELLEGRALHLGEVDHEAEDDEVRHGRVYHHRVHVELQVDAERVQEEAHEAHTYFRDQLKKCRVHFAHLLPDVCVEVLPQHREQLLAHFKGEHEPIQLDGRLPSEGVVHVRHVEQLYRLLKGVDQGQDQH